jgi:phage terminase large subunit-like protein
MTITEGDVIDDVAVKRFILELGRKYQVKELLMDQFNSTILGTELLSEGFNVFRFPQNFKHYNGPCKEWEKAVAEGRFGHDGNSLLRWAVGNVRLDVDAYANCKPSRGKSADKIDPVVSTLMAFSRACEASADVQPRKSVYDGRGILCL